MKKKNGFTLFELLVSISIIAVLTAVAVVSFGGVSKRARDAKRTADLEKIRMAMEAIKQVGGTYPSSINLLVSPTPYLQQIPLDPKDKTAYSFVSTNYTYTLGAKMEDVGSTNCTSCSGTCSGGCNYNVTNP